MNLAVIVNMWVLDFISSFLLILLGASTSKHIHRYDTNEEERTNWIFPGTKWCGVGNISQNIDDVGKEKETDRCCKAHDFCEDYILGGKTKYNLKNPTHHTRLSCECDEEFYKCLKEANTLISNKVGFLYFNFLGTQCFRKDYPVKRCIKKILLPLKCLKYEYDTNKTKIYQWFDSQKY